jgi:hypothetical protein
MLSKNEISSMMSSADVLRASKNPQRTADGAKAKR